MPTKCLFFTCMPNTWLKSATVYEIPEVLISACQCEESHGFHHRMFLLATNIFLTCIPKTWFQLVTVNGFWRFTLRITLRILRASFWQNSNRFYRWIVWFATNTCSHTYVKFSVSQWPLRIFDDVLHACSVLQLHLVFGNIQSSDTWFVTNILFFFNRWTGDHQRICNILFCAFAIRLLHSDYQRNQKVCFVTFAHNRSIILDVICHIRLLYLHNFQNRSNNLCNNWPYINNLWFH